jgi:hypothetical protein
VPPDPDEGLASSHHAPAGEKERRRVTMYSTTCRLCLDSHDRDDVLCSTCRRFADWWTGLSPDECRRHEQLIGDYVDVLLPRTSQPVKTLTSGRFRSHARA